jgi:hypothetical protein
MANSTTYSGAFPVPQVRAREQFFAGVMGFTDESLAEALTAHLQANLETATIAHEQVVIIAPMIGPNGRTAMVRTIWQVLSDASLSFITAYPE